MSPVWANFAKFKQEVPSGLGREITHNAACVAETAMAKSKRTESFVEAYTLHKLK